MSTVTGTVSVRGAEFAYCDTRPTTAVKGTILALHSLFLNQSSFDPLIEPCVQAGYRFVTYDLRGQGRSSAPAESSDEELSIAGGTADAGALIRRLRIEGCHVLGSSQGGMIGLGLTVREPDLLRSLVTMGSSAQEEEENQRKIFSAALDRIAALGPAAEIETLSHVMFGRTSLRENPGMVATWRGHMCRLPHDIARVARGVINRPRILERLSPCHVEVTAIAGEEDTTYPPISAKTIADATGGNFVEIPYAGHSPVIEQPEQVIEQVLNHLAAVG